METNCGDCGSCGCDCGANTTEEKGSTAALGVMTETEKSKALFLTAMATVLAKYNMTWKDIVVDWEKGTIDIKSDMKPEEIIGFLTDLDKSTGGFD